MHEPFGLLLDDDFFAGLVDDAVIRLSGCAFAVKAVCIAESAVAGAVCKGTRSKFVRLKPVQHEAVSVIRISSAVVDADGQQRVFADKHRQLLITVHPPERAGAAFAAVQHRPDAIG